MMSLDQIHAREEIPTEHQAQILNPAMQHLPAREATTGSANAFPPREAAVTAAALRMERVPCSEVFPTRCSLFAR